MCEHRDRGHDCCDRRHERGHDERCCEPRHRGEHECRCRDEGGRGEHEHGRECDRRGGHGAGPDTRFLQLEMSQVLYAEAESVTKQALRELLLEAAKARFRERFGDKITGLAQLAVDELMADVLSSLDIEARIHQRNQERGRTKERLRDIFGERGSAGECGPGHEERGREGASPGEGAGGEGGGGTGGHEER